MLFLIVRKWALLNAVKAENLIDWTSGDGERDRKGEGTSTHAKPCGVNAKDLENAGAGRWLIWIGITSRMFVVDLRHGMASRLIA